MILTSSLYAGEYAKLASFAEYSTSSNYGMQHNYYFEKASTGISKNIAGRAKQSDGDYLAKREACQDIVMKITGNKKPLKYCIDLQVLQTIYDKFGFKVVSTYYYEVKYDSGYSKRTMYTLFKE